MPNAEPRNWFFTLLVPVSIVFLATAIAVTIIPVMEQKAAQSGFEPPPSAFRDALRRDGWLWVMIEMAIVVALSLAAMIWDRFRKPPTDVATPGEGG